jgi:hypothetical protein
LYGAGYVGAFFVALALLAVIATGRLAKASAA